MGEQVEKPPEKPGRPKINSWIAVTVALAVLLAAAVLTGGFGITGAFITETDAQTAAARAIDFINENILQGRATATLIDVTEDSGLYKLTVSMNGRQFELYLSKDGSLLFLQAIDLTEIPETQPFDAPDAERPVVKFFVMSFCPYGQQAETALQSVYELLGDKADFEPHFVIYSGYGDPEQNCIANGTLCSMHGLAELREDIRQMCIDKYYPADVWWAYVSYVNANCSLADIGSCWLDAAAAAGIDIDEITTCLNDEGEDLAAAELALNDRYGVRGSPTIFINGERYAGGRSPEDLKQAVCSGFSSPPDECGQMLSTTVATASGSC